MPASHDGGTSFDFNIEFSESVWVGHGFPRNQILRVTGGTVTSAHWLDRNTRKWKVTIRPETRDSISVVLPKGRYCVTVISDGTRQEDLAQGAPCAVWDRQLSNQPESTIPGPTSQQQGPNNPAAGGPGIYGSPRAGQTLTANTSGIQDQDGMTDAVFAYQWLSNDAAIESATASTYTVAAADVGKALKVRVTFTDDAGSSESLTSAATAAVAPKPLTASVHNTPQSHDGQSVFTFELRFSETPKTSFSYVTLRDHAFTVTGGEVVKARRLEPGNNIGWEISVRPDSSARLCTKHR